MAAAIFQVSILLYLKAHDVSERLSDTDIPHVTAMYVSTAEHVSRLWLDFK
jgi:hypothetical protein